MQQNVSIRVTQIIFHFRYVIFSRATTVLPLSIGLFFMNFLVTEIEENILRSMSFLWKSTFFIMSLMNWKSWFLKRTNIIRKAEPREIIFNMFDSVIYLNLFVEGRRKSSPNYNKPTTLLGIWILQILINYFSLGSNKFLFWRM